MPAKGWSTSKYKDTMPDQLIKMMSQGKDQCAFCAFHNISTKTFERWLVDKPELAEAYEVAKVKSKEWYMNVAQEHLVEQPMGSRLNTTLWSMMMRNRFDLTEHRKLKIESLKKAKTFADQMQCVIDEVAAGNLTTAEAQQVAGLVEAGVKINEHTEMAKRIEQLEQADKLGVNGDDFKD